jgi:peptide subunit release factor 1 (eRF1)
MLNQKTIERLSKMGGKEFYITSLYLNVDKSQKTNDYKIVTKDLLKDRRRKLDQYKASKRLSREQAQSIENDFEKIERFVHHEFIHKDHPKGLALFSCSATEFWELLEVPQPLPNYLNADYDPFVRPLSELLCDHRNYAVLLVDSTKAKILDVTLGFVKEHLNIEDNVQSKVKFGGMEGTQERNIGRAHDEMVHKHFRHVVTETEKLCDHKDIMWLILGGTQKVISQFEPLLSGPIRKKIIGHMVVEPEAPLHDILQKSEEVAKRAELKYETDLIDKLKGEAHTNGGKGIFGLQPTLQSLRKGGVNTLVVAKGFTAPGFVCHKCFFIGTPEEKGAKDTCPICSGAAHNVDDVIEEAITFAFMQGCRVENTSENSRLKIMGNVGALLRF